MKKIMMLLSIFGVLLLSACEGPPGPPGYDGLDGQDGYDGLIAEVFELKNVNFNYNATDGYTIYRSLTPNIYASDVLLIYRMSGTINANTPIWQQIPRTLYLSEGELDYDFDFSKEDFTIYAGGNYDLSLTPSYINNQTFRIVIVPGSFSKSLKSLDYNSVVKALNIDESQIQIFDF